MKYKRKAGFSFYFRMKVFSAKPEIAIRIENCKLNRDFISSQPYSGKDRTLTNFLFSHLHIFTFKVFSGGGIYILIYLYIYYIYKYINSYDHKIR